MPDHITDGDKEALQDLRKSLWRQGFIGFGFGSVLGQAGYLAARRIPRLQRRFLPNANHSVSATLLCGAAGMFLGSVVAGREGVHTIHWLMHKGAKLRPAAPPQKDTAYQLAEESEILGRRREHSEARPNWSQYWDDTAVQRSQLAASGGTSADCEWEATRRQETGKRRWDRDGHRS